MYGDVETLLCPWLKPIVQVDNIVPELPYNLQFVVPLIAIERFGGADDTITLDRANIDVDVFHTSRLAAKTLAEQVRKALRVTLPGTTLGSATVGWVTVSRVETISGPSVAPWDNTQLRRVTAAYRLYLHAHNL